MPAVPSAAEVHRTVHAVFRIESPKLIGALARMLRDVGRAEELAQDALLAALETWPEQGVPDNPGAWLTQTAKRKAIDELRRHRLLERKHAELGRDALETRPDDALAIETAVDDDIGDDLLRLVFTSCHPVLSVDARVSLTLRVLGGLSTAEIARAFLTTEPTIQQRIVRAKKALADANVPFEVPRGQALAARLGSVLEVVYLIFNEGYSATTGDDWMRPELCQDALRLGRILAGLMPDEREVLGLLALMEIQGSRSRARIGPSGEPVLLLDQNRALWDFLAIGRGLAALDRANALGGEPGTYQLQASIAACHARARRAEDTDWVAIAALYQDLAELTGSPIVELNRAVAVGMAAGPAAGLAVLDGVASAPALRGYHLLPSVRGNFLEKLGRFQEAGKELRRAAELTQNSRERELLLARAASVGNRSQP
ncbi:MAG TPA: RNA polymerase sigma factor [Polyangiaceae bacterium]|nr:RNA polymerase sigma factor [Polyangiaceae bacterium]